MAIVEMKRASVLALKADEPALLSAIQKLGCFQLTPLAEDGDDAGFSKARTPADLPRLEDELIRIAWAIGRLVKYDKSKAPMLGGKRVIEPEEAQAVLAKQGALMRTVEALEALEREAGELRGSATRIGATLEQLSHWQKFAMPMEQVHSTRNTVAMLGTLQMERLQALEAEGVLGALCVVDIVDTFKELAYVYVVMHRSVQEEAMQALKQANFSPVTLTFTGTAAEQMNALSAELTDIARRQSDILKDIAQYAKDLPDLRILSDCLHSRKDQLLAAQGFIGSQHTVYLWGWVPEPMTTRVEKTLRKASPTASVEFTDPAEGDVPPVLLHNNMVVNPFESVVAGFSLPSPTGMDPTAVMMPFFANFMGMMISDAGYGILMAMLIPIMIKFMKPSAGAKNLMKILFWGGIATIIWGALFNTWFGFGPWPSVFDPVNNALPVMAVCIGLGAVHLFAGLGVAAYMNIKRGHPLAAVADQLSWFLLVVGLILMILLPSVGQWMALAGVGIILVTSGREKSKNPLKRLLSGLGALYGATGWISDLLSYMRLFGMGLATGVIGMVFNQLVGMVFNAGIIGKVLGVALFVFAHLFNAGINILGAYVHSCRLQYIEFFGKFYEDGGKPFMPLQTTSRYVSIQEASERT